MVLNYVYKDILFLMKVIISIYISQRLFYKSQFRVDMVQILFICKTIYIQYLFFGRLQ